MAAMALNEPASLNLAMSMMTAFREVETLWPGQLEKCILPRLGFFSNFFSKNFGKLKASGN